MKKLDVLQAIKKGGEKISAFNNLRLTDNDFRVDFVGFAIAHMQSARKANLCTERTTDTLCRVKDRISFRTFGYRHVTAMRTVAAMLAQIRIAFGDLFDGR